ncbi:siderophore-interacting protein [Brevibacterium sp. RIT 803]|uniref:siderophore-interacting protein n=1 Tax=Brevibacterium sp. RIT 803 TaxID=2810210 RepID=UPI00194EC4C6|nr:siderophore-interacting protein [Brevibacterium sp. RIT 803]MBM6591767.1 siderophore-interacting protein [Brevibacterium sp. RIT 803]
MPRTSRPMQVLPIVLREVEVTGIADITPNMRRLTVAGDQLSAGVVNGMPRPQFLSEGFDDHVKLVIPTPETESLDIGEQGDFRFNWNREALRFTRDYTVSSVDADSNSFTVDVVRHDSGLAAEWAFSASVGDSLKFAGPKSSAGISEGIDFHLLVADETALPAVRRWLETAPVGTSGHVIVEVPTAEDIQEISTAADVEIDWLIRSGTSPGGSTLMYEAVKNLVLPVGRTYAWCAGEALTIAPIRRHLRRELGLPKEDVEVIGYWRKVSAVTKTGSASGEIAGDATSETVTSQTAASQAATSQAAASDGVTTAGGDEVADVSESSQSIVGNVHEMTEILPPIITRIAVTLGIGDLVAGGITTAEAIATAAGIDTEGARVVLTAMCALGLLERDGAAYRNTQAGAVLIGDGAGDGLNLDDPAIRDLFSIVNLLDVLRNGHGAKPAPASAGKALTLAGEALTLAGEAPTWRAQRGVDAALDTAHRSHTLDHLRYVLDIILELEPIATAASVALAGDAGAEVSAALTRKAPESGRSVYIPGTASVGGDQPWPVVDCTLMLAGLTGRCRTEAQALLARILESSASIVIVEPLTDEAELDDHQAEELVATYAMTGNASWTSEELRECLSDLGVAAVEVVDIGWGFGRFRSAVIARRA